ncbi:hypothetical protein ABTM94_19860, partial [Acinetobacter baumannii]
EANQFGLNARDARDEVRAVAAVVDGWRDHFVACGVSASDIDLLAAQNDRPDWVSQRTAAR